MKKLLFLLLILPILAQAQSDNRSGVFLSFRAGTALWLKNITRTASDTTQALMPWKYTKTAIELKVYDSASITVKYQVCLGDTGSNLMLWSPPVTLDSLSSDVNAGAFKAFTLADSVNSAYMVRFIFTKSGFRVGTTDSTYTARYIQKRY